MFQNQVVSGKEELIQYRRMGPCFCQGSEWTSSQRKKEMSLCEELIVQTQNSDVIIYIAYGEKNYKMPKDKMHKILKEPT